MDNIKPIPPFKRFCGMLGAFPEAFSDSMTVYEALEWLYRYLGTEVVPKTNECIELTKELKEYVEHYFDNLDVQEEINNKLDAMAEAGTLQEIIAEYLQANVTWTFDSVADMKSATNLINGSYAKTLGFHSVNDGGGAVYKITDSGTANEMDVIAINDLYAVLVNPTNVKQYGAYGDNEHDDSPFIQRAISQNLHGSIHFPVGEYAIYDPINITSTIKITGEGLYSELIKKDDSAYNSSINYNNVSFNFNDYPSIFNAIFPTNQNLTYLIVDGLRFSEDIDGNSNVSTGIVAPHLSYSSIRNCRFNNLDNCIILGGWCNKIDKCEFFTSNLATNVLSSFYFINNHISNSYVNGTYFLIKNGRNCSIENCQGDSVGSPYFFIDCSSISLSACSTEAWEASVKAENSYVNIDNCDLELHKKDRYSSFIVATLGSTVNVNDSYIHYEDYETPGEYPATKNIVTNSGASKIYINNCKISIPFTYTDYLSGNGVNKINDYVKSNILSELSEIKTQITAGTKVEIARLPFAYGKRLQVFINGYGGHDYAVVTIDASISALNRGPDARIIELSDNTVYASNNASYGASITAEYDSDELVLYFNEQIDWNFPTDVTVKYNTV